MKSFKGHQRQVYFVFFFVVVFGGGGGWLVFTKDDKRWQLMNVRLNYILDPPPPKKVRLLVFGGDEGFPFLLSAISEEYVNRKVNVLKF